MKRRALMAVVVVLIMGVEDSALFAKEKPKPKAPESAAATQEPIRPFGPFSWEDDLLTVVMKTNSLPGIERVALSSDAPLNLKDVQTQEQLQAVLTEYLSKVRSVSEDSYHDQLRLELIQEYVDVNGNKTPYWKQPMALIASPIVIAGVPFDLTIEFISSPGFAVVHPDQLAKDPNRKYAFPHVIREVSLVSNSPILVQKRPEIDQMLESKYRKYDPDRRRIVDWSEATVRDPQWPLLTLLMVTGGTREYSLRYRSEVFARSLTRLYDEHVAKLEANKLGDKTDLKGGL